MRKLKLLTILLLSLMIGGLATAVHSRHDAGLLLIIDFYRHRYISLTGGASLLDDSPLRQLQDVIHRSNSGLTLSLTLSA